MSTVYGLTGYPADNLSYVSWAQQSKGDRWLFEILYTTTAHERLFFNPLFLLIGKLSSLLSASPLLVLNVLAAFSLPVFIICFSNICRALGLGGAATFAATCLAVGGGGVSWIRKAVGWVGFNQFLPVGQPGPDFSYFDLYPAAAYFIYSYHAISFAMVAMLVLLIVQLDDHQSRLTVKRSTLLIGSAFVLATVRPHIPIMIVAAYGAATIATFAFKLPRMMLIRRLIIAACLAGAMLPPVLYSVWVSQQPVWSAYSGTYRPTTEDWAIGFFFLWVLAGAGIGVLGSRVLRSPFAFLVSWALGSGVLLLILNGHVYPKLCAGSTIGLAALAGVVVDKYKDRLRSRLSLTAALAVIAFVALASPAVIVLRFAVDRTGTASELFQVIQTIRSDTAAPFPTVLTDCGTGVMLPGLSGYRVFCGHWALTENNRQKIVLLSSLGFLAEGKPMPSFPEVGDDDIVSGARLLLDQIRDNTFQYLVVQKTFRIFQEFESVAPQCNLQSGKRYAVLRMCPEVKTVFERIGLTTQSSSRTR